jgi:hypothetical protein
MPVSGKLLFLISRETSGIISRATRFQISNAEYYETLDPLKIRGKMPYKFRLFSIFPLRTLLSSALNLFYM